MKNISLTLGLLLTIQFAFANTTIETESTSPQAGAEPVLQKEMTLQEKKAHVSTFIEQNKEQLGEKKAEKLENLLNKRLEKADKKAKTISPEKAAKKEAKLKKMLEKRDAKLAKAAEQNSSYVRLGVILALIGVVLYILISGILGSLFIAVGLILLIIGLI